MESLDNVLDALKLLTGIGGVASEDAQMLGLLVFIEALVAMAQLVSARVTGTKDSSICSLTCSGCVAIAQQSAY